MRHVLTLVLVLSMLGTLHGQQGVVPRPSFEVASVKENRSGDTRFEFSYPTSGRFTATNAPLEYLIGYAFQIDAVLMKYLLIGGPANLLATRFDLTAVAPSDTPAGQQPVMMQQLLADRFGLRTHVEARPTPVYALVPVRPGEYGKGLRQSRFNCPDFTASRQRGEAVEAPVDMDGRPWCSRNYEFGPGRIGIRGAGSVQELFRFIQAYVDRPLIDDSGIRGNIEFAMTFSNNSMPSGETPTVYTAIQESLGLRLEPRTAPTEVRVIDAVQTPTPD